MSEQPRGRRVVVRSADVRPASRRPPAATFDERSEYRDVLVRSLMRAQFGLSLSFIVLTVAILGSVPLVAALAPSVASKHLFGLPVTLAVLGVIVYPVLVVIGVVYVHFAERTERHFLDLVDRL